MTDDNHLDCFDAGAALHKAKPELMLCEAERLASARYPTDKAAGRWFMLGYSSARKQRDEFLQERSSTNV